MLRRVVRSWRARVAVEGDSMRPTLEPGDWLLCDPAAYRQRPPQAGELVLVPDPRLPSRLLVKRVTEVLDGGQELYVRGDDPAGSTDSRSFGTVGVDQVEGRPWFRYWPPRRAGRID